MTNTTGTDWAANIITPENVLPSRRTVFFATVFGVAALTNLWFAAGQLGFAYFSGEGLDATPYLFFWVAMAYLIATYAAGYQLRKIARTLGLRRGIRKRVVVAQYDPPCSPGVAGILLDLDYGSSEAKAMMIDLAYRGHLHRRSSDVGETWTHTPSDHDLQPYERIFINQLFQARDELQLPAEVGRFIGAADLAHDALLDKARTQGYIAPTPPQVVVWPSLSKVMRLIGYIIIAIMFLNLALFPAQVLAIGYPRYPVELWQLGFIVGQLGILLAVTGWAYIRSLVTARGLDLGTNIVGFYIYIKTVFRYPEKYLSASDMRTYYPYAVAFRLPTRLAADAGDRWDILLGL